MKPWEAFEYTTQFMLAPLLADATQKTLFRETNRCHERMFFDLLVRVMKPTHFFELGAYEAKTARQAAARLPEAVCYAFEADAEVYGHFSSIHRKDPTPPNFSYIHSAISDYDGQASFQKQVRGQSILGFLPPNNSLLQKQAETGYEEVTTPCQRLDSFVRPFAAEVKRAVLRLDVEGSCYEALAGSEQILDASVAIYAEVEDMEIWKGQKLVFDIHRLLDEKGFVPVSRDVQTPAQYNILWLRKDDSVLRKFRSRIALYNTELQHIVLKSLSAASAAIEKKLL
jgi:FkbM family methyltransferase